jgi:hypothetical protein
MAAKKISFSHARRLCEDNDLHGAVLVGFRFDRTSEGVVTTFSMTSYGENKSTCAALASVGEQVVNQLMSGSLEPCVQ